MDHNAEGCKGKAPAPPRRSARVVQALSCRNALR